MTTIRTATIADAVELSRFAERVFVESFGADNDPDDMRQYMSGAFSVALQSAEIADPRGVILLLEVDAGTGGRALAGYAHLQEVPAPPVVRGPAPLELKRFYIDASHHGRGLAGALMAEVLRTAAARGARTLWLGVWEHNARAIAFYRKHGFQRVGEHEFVLGTDPQTDWLMARAVSR